MSIFLSGLHMTQNVARDVVGEEIAHPYAEEFSLSNAVPQGMHGLPAYMTTRGDMEGPLGTIIPGDGSLKYFLAAALGIALTQIPAALLIPKLGFWKGYLAGASISGAVLTALYVMNKKRTSEQVSTPQKVG